MSDTYNDTSLFLMKATLGANKTTIDSVSSKGINNWLDEQLNSTLKDEELFHPLTKNIWGAFRSTFLQVHGEAAINGKGNNPALPYWFYFRMAWWQKTLEENNNHMLRQRVAQALSEILVISDESILQLDSLGLASFYDILYKNAFGNYTDILEEVSLHPMMGVYLSHLNNKKAVPEKNIHPDENYAREIMQLFTIGLNELNKDGSLKKDSNGNNIPTYTNDDIKEMAKVFTGLKGSEYLYEWSSFFAFNNTPITFGDGVDKTYKTIPYINMEKPMLAEEEFHDKTAKVFLNGKVNIPSGQSTMADIKKVVSDLVKHPNTAPFIAKKMIQQLVTSNPSPKYILDVATAFGNTGNMKEMIKTILTHSEAKSAKKLKSPFLRATQILKAFSVTNKSKKLWVLGENIDDTLHQHVLSSPTVFNFYLPSYTPHGELEQNNLVAPEFQLHNSATSIAYSNLMYAWLFGNALPLVSTSISSKLKNVPETDVSILGKNEDDKLTFNFEYEINLAKEKKFDELIEHIGTTLTGKSNLFFKADIRDSFKNYESEPLWVVQTIIFMIVISPDFTVLKG